MKKLQFVSLLLCLALALGGCGDVTIGESQSNAGQSAQAGEQTVGQSQGEEQVLSNERIPYRKDKTGDDRFFILTLIAIAEELTARGVDEKELYRIQLPVGLPPAHFGAQAEKFTA